MPAKSTRTADDALEVIEIAPKRNRALGGLRPIDLAMGDDAGAVQQAEDTLGRIEHGVFN